MRILGLASVASLVAFPFAVACDPDMAVTCDRLSSTVQVAVGAGQSQAAANIGCNGASDCVVASTSTACAPGCDVVLTKTGAARLKVALDQVNATTCDAFANKGCQAGAAPSCLPVFPACMGGLCVALDAAAPD
jgi:hypothetical protein